MHSLASLYYASSYLELCDEGSYDKTEIISEINLENSFFQSINFVRRYQKLAAKLVMKFEI